MKLQIVFSLSTQTILVNGIRVIARTAVCLLCTAATWFACRYAKRSKDTRLEWNEFTKDYLLNRTTLANVFLLIDASIPPTQVDLECADWLGASQVPFALVFTKLDKRKKGCPPPQENMALFKDTLLQEWEQLPFSLETSALKNIGRQELLSHIASLRVLWQQEH